MLFGMSFCPYVGGGYNPTDGIWCFGIKVFLVVWVVFVPIAITNRLERIIKLLEDKKSK